MMNTAAVMTVGEEQTKVHSVASGLVESGEMSFAHSFGERVGFAVDAQMKSSSGDALNGIRGWKGSEHLKNADVLPSASVGTKANAVANREVIEPDENKDAAMTAADGLGKSSFGRGQPQTSSEQLPKVRGELLQNIRGEIVAQAGVSQEKSREATATKKNEEQPVRELEVEAIETIPSVSCQRRRPQSVCRKRALLLQIDRRSLVPEFSKQFRMKPCWLGRTWMRLQLKRASRPRRARLERRPQRRPP